MSFELYVQFLESGRPAGVARAALRGLFPVADAASEPDYWSVVYGPSNDCGLSLTPSPNDPGLIESLCVVRPCADSRLWDDLLTLLQMSPSVLFFPGEAPPLVASAETGALVTVDMADALGTPRVVRSGQEIADIVRSA